MSRASNSHQCRHCGAATRSGLDSDVAAIVVKVDDEPVTWEGELLAVVRGRRTYALENQRLYQRTRWHLRKPATAAYVQHVCWEPFPASWLAPIPATYVMPDEPAF